MGGSWFASRVSVVEDVHAGGRTGELFAFLGSEKGVGAVSWRGFSDSYLGVFCHSGVLPDIVLVLSEVNLLVRRTKEGGEGSCSGA